MNGPHAALRLATWAAVVGIATSIAIPVLAFAVAPAFVGQNAKHHDLGPIADYSTAGFVRATFSAGPTVLDTVRTTVYVRYEGLVASQPSFTILASRDSYLGCPVESIGRPGPGRQTYKDVSLTTIVPSGFGSTCHDGMRYDREGNRVSGPVSAGLRRYPFSIRDGHLFIATPA